MTRRVSNALPPDREVDALTTPVFQHLVPSTNYCSLPCSCQICMVELSTEETTHPVGYETAVIQTYCMQLLSGLLQWSERSLSWASLKSLGPSAGWHGWVDSRASGKTRLFAWRPRFIPSSSHMQCATGHEGRNYPKQSDHGIFWVQTQCIPWNS